MLRLLFLIVFFLSILFANGQEAEIKKKEQVVKFSGALSLSANAYSNGNVGIARQSPFSYALSGSPNLTIYKVSLPFTFIYSDQKFSYSQPFNQFGVSPTYKWIKVHLGYSSMNFSSYSIAGRQFLGAGIELTPGKFYLGGLYGRLDNLLAKKDSLVYGATLIDTYKRHVYGGKIGIGRKTKFEILGMKVKDDLESAMPQEGDNIRLLPQDNVVVGINFKTTILKVFEIKLESAGSLHTSDARQTIALDSAEVPDIVLKINKVIKTNISTRWGFAGKIEFNLNLKKFNMGFGYQRIEPNFKTLGVYYMVTDLENYTAHLGTKLFNNHLRLKIKGGFQRNNLSLIRQSTNLRKIGSVQASYINPNGFVANFNFNNLQTDQQAGYVEIEDSLRLAISNKSSILNLAYNWNKPIFQHSINLNFGITNFKDINEQYFVPIGESQNNNINLTYRIQHKRTQMNYSFGVNYYLLTSENTISTGTGLSASIGKKMLDKKLSLRFNGSANKRTVEGVDDGIHLRFRANMSYKITKKQRLGCYASLSKRPSFSKRPLNETRASITYSINF